MPAHQKPRPAIPEFRPDRTAQEASRRLLADPQAAEALLREIALTSQTMEKTEDQIYLLSLALEEARFARENGRRRGAEFIAAMEAALKAVAEAEGLKLAGSLAVSTAWLRAGLEPPEAVCLRLEEAGEASDVSREAPKDPPPLSGLLADLDESLGVTGLHLQFAPLLYSLPPEIRRVLAGSLIAHPAPAILADLGCAWLLSLSEPLREGAMDGLEERLEAGLLEAGSLARLAVVRSWLPQEALRGRLDALMRAALKRGIGGEGPRPRKIHKILSSMVDGVGAQSLAAAVQTGEGKRLVAMFLIKAGFGVKDAFVIPCSSASEQRRVLEAVGKEVGALETTLAHLAEILEGALAEGLACGHAPPTGLIEAAELCGLQELRPHSAPLKERLSKLDPEGRLSGLSPQALGKLIHQSKGWIDRWPIAENWFEDRDEVEALLGPSASLAVAKRELWRWFEGRRGFWAEIIARNALLLHAAGETQAAWEFFAVATALDEGRPLKKIPVMVDIHESTLGFWGFEAFLAADDAAALEPPAPEKKGELAALLKRAGMSEAWLHGYAAAGCVALGHLPLNDWPGLPLARASETLGLEELKRLFELLFFRLGLVFEALKDERGDAPPILNPRSAKERAQWAQGFLDIRRLAPKLWPSRGLPKQDRAALRLLERIALGEAPESDLQREALPWIRIQLPSQV